MEYQDCLICKENQATKTNSHMIPSFMVAKVCSYDGRGKRDQEVMFTLTPYEENVYVGGIPDTKLEELFDTDKLTDERIEKELSNNTVSRDYIFCPKCESSLSIYLESPYATYIKQGKTINPDVAYFFWVSIIWRVSISKIFGFKLQDDIEQHLGKCLQEYFECVQNGRDANHIVDECNMVYRVLRCPSFFTDNDNASYLGGMPSKDANIITLTLGDIVICATFNKSSMVDYNYYGLESKLIEAPVNNGKEAERYVEIEPQTLKDANTQMIQKVAHVFNCHQKKLADEIWNRIGLPGVMPNEIFIEFMEAYHSESVKPGDRKTKERYVDIFNQTLKRFGYVLK